MTLRVLIIGGAGAFGSRIAWLLRNDRGLELVLAGRDKGKLAAACRKLIEAGAAATPLTLDISREDLAPILRDHQIDFVIHTAGPFQSQHHDVPRACIAAGVDVIDLADSHTYVDQIRHFDTAAKTAGCAVISGASSVPALSSAAVDSLGAGLPEIRSIVTRISPGNRAPRGLAVVKAILSYVGRPIPGWNDGLPAQRIGWSNLHRRTLSIPGLAPLRNRWFSACDAPDLTLFPQHVPQLKVVEFYAGLELSILHLGLSLLSWLPRKRYIASLRPFAGVLRFIAALFYPFGSDRGGMTVEVEGRAADGKAVLRRWTLIAEKGDGVNVPCLAAVVLTRRRRQGRVLPPGAYACVGVVSLAEFEDAMSGLQIRTHAQAELAPLYQRVLGPAYDVLPAPIRAMHDIDVTMYARGNASVHRGSNPIANLLASVFGFPKSKSSTTVDVTFTPGVNGELWERQFGGHKFHSLQYEGRKPGEIIERFGPFAFAMEVEASPSGIRLLPRKAWFGPIPLPRVLVSRIAASERIAADGRFEFDVAIRLPLIGELVHYNGQLYPPTPF